MFARFVNEECSRVMKGKGDHCFKVRIHDKLVSNQMMIMIYHSDYHPLSPCLQDNQNGWGWLKLVTHQTLRWAGAQAKEKWKISFYMFK